MARPLNLSRVWTLLVLAALVLAPSPARAQRQIGPDAFGYRASNIYSPAEDISGTGVQILDAVDDGTTDIPIGFNFSFYGSSWSTVWVSSNGLLSFGAGNTTFTNASLNGALTTDAPTIAVLWDDYITTNAADAVYYETRGTPGSRRLIVQWNVVRPFGDANSFLTFQAVLAEGSNDIILRYPDVIADAQPTRSNAASATIGIRDTAGHLTSRRLQWSFNTDAIRSGDALIFERVRAGRITGSGAFRAEGRTGSFGVSARVNATGPVFGDLTINVPGAFTFRSLAVTRLDIEGNIVSLSGAGRVGNQPVLFTWTVINGPTPSARLELSNGLDSGFIPLFRGSISVQGG